MRRAALVGLALATLTLMGCSKKADETTTPTTTPPTTAPAAAGAGAGANAAGAGGPFCAEMTQLAAKSKSSSGSGMPTQGELDGLLAQMKKSQAAAPTNLKDSFTTLSDTFREIGKLGNDPAAVGRVLALAGDPKVQKAADDVQAYTKTTCNIDLNLPGGDSTAPTAPTSARPGGPTTSVDKTSIDAVKAAVQAKAGAAAWTKAVLETGIWQYQASGESFDWEVQLAPGTKVSSADAVAACKLIGDYLAPLQPGFTVTIKDAEAKAIATRPRSSACSAA